MNRKIIFKIFLRAYFRWALSYDRGTPGLLTQRIDKSLYFKYCVLNNYQILKKAFICLVFRLTKTLQLSFKHFKNFKSDVTLKIKTISIFS